MTGATGRRPAVCSGTRSSRPFFPFAWAVLSTLAKRRCAPFVCAMASYLSPLVPDLLSKERNVRHVFPHAGCSCPNHTASQWLDLAEDRLRLDRLAATAAQNFLPLGVPPIPREPRNFCSRRPPLRSGRKAVRRRSPPACRSPSRPRWSRARKQQGDETWLTLVLSRNPVPKSRAKS